MGIFKCYFSGEYIALPLKKQQQQRCEGRIRKKPTYLKQCSWCKSTHEINKLCVNRPRQSMKTKSICRYKWQKKKHYPNKQH